MKDNRIDKLFQEKLRDWEKSPPTLAWDKVNAQLHKEKSPLLWWHKAAIVAILCLGGALVFSLTNRTAKMQETATTTVPDENQAYRDQIEGGYSSQEKIAAIGNKDTSREASTSVENDSKEPLDTASKGAYINNHMTAKLPEESSAKAQSQNEKLNQKPSIDAIDLLAKIDHEPKVEIVEVVQIADAKKALPITIEFKAGKELIEAEVAHTDAPKSSSPLRKLTEKLKELKNTEIDLANLREAKDNLLAFDSYREGHKISEK